MNQLDILRNAIKKIKTEKEIGKIGFTGSMKTERDIDLIIMPSGKTKIGKFLKSLNNYLKRLNEETEKMVPDQ